MHDFRLLSCSTLVSTSGRNEGGAGLAVLSIADYATCCRMAGTVKECQPPQRRLEGRADNISLHSAGNRGIGIRVGPIRMHTAINRTTCLLGYYLLGSVLVAALQASDSSMTASRARAGQILDEATAALGGAKFLGTRDLVGSGWIGSSVGDVNRHMRGKIYLRFTSDAVEERQAYNKDESHVVLFNEAGGYELTFRGARPLDPGQVSRFREDSRNNILNILHQRRQEPGLVAEYRGTTVCERQSGVLVDIISADENDPVVSVCFSSVTKLPVKQSYVRRHPLTRDRIEEVTIYARYFDAGDGVLWPRHISRLRDDAQISETFLDSVQVNQNLSAELFSVPVGARPLKPIPSIESEVGRLRLRGD